MTGQRAADVHAVPPARPAAFDDPDFLRALRAGDPAAFERFVPDLTPRLLPVARRMMPSEADAEDALQDAFLSGYKNLGKFDGQSKLSTWMHRITVNACLMRLRTRARRPERAIEDMLPTFDETGHQSRPAGPWNQGGGTGIQSAELAALLREKVAELPEPYRVVILLRDIEGLSTDEAAAALGVTANTVKIRLHRARMALKTLLDPFFAPGTGRQDARP